jgi:predicted RNA-binding Zn ribbon-like protein
METTPVESAFELSGGALCLDFVNTLGDRPRCRNETLQRPADLLRWGAAAGLLEPAGTEPDRRGQASAAFRRAIDLRESLYRIFSARVAFREADGADLDLLNRHLRPALTQLELRSEGECFRLDWSGSPEPFERVLGSVARSAAELLTSPELERLRECASDRCSWLFLDRSRSRRRRWCDMKTCGNRAKARRHYRRRKARAAG